MPRMTRRQRSEQRKVMNRLALRDKFSESRTHADVLAVQIPHLSYQSMDEEQMRSAVRGMLVERMEIMSKPQRIVIDAERASVLYDQAQWSN